MAKSILIIAITAAFCASSLGRRAQAKDKPRQIIENFNSILSEEDFALLRTKAEDKMVQQVVNNANGELSESAAREVVRKGLMGMTDEDAQQIIRNAEETMSEDDARRFVSAEHAMLADADGVSELPKTNGDTERHPKASRHALVQRILSNYKDSLSSEDAKQLSKMAEDSMVSQILTNSNGGLAEDDARQIIQNAEMSMTEDDAEHIIEKAADEMSVEDARHLVNELEEKTKVAEHTDAQEKTRQIIENFNSILSKEDFALLRTKAEDKMVQQVVNNANGELSESAAREVVRNGLMGMTHEDARQIINEAEETMSEDDARRFVSAEHAMLVDADGVSELPKTNGDTERNPKASRHALVQRIVNNYKDSLSSKDAKQLSKMAEDSMVSQILTDSNGAFAKDEARQTIQNAKVSMPSHQANDEVKQIVDNFDKSLSKDDSDHLLSKAEDMMTHEIIQSSGGTLSESEARDIVRKGEDAMTDEDAQHIIERAEETMSADDIRRVVNVAEEAVLDAHMEEAARMATGANSLNRQHDNAKVGVVKSSPGAFGAGEIARNAGKSMIKEAEQIYNSAKKAFHMDGAHQKRHKNDDSAIGAVREHVAGHSMKKTNPSQIINRASDMISVADFKMSTPSSPGLMGLASPFGVA